MIHAKLVETGFHILSFREKSIFLTLPTFKLFLVQTADRIVGCLISLLKQKEKDLFNTDIRIKGKIS